ncbi:choline transporter [Pacificimonas flava]|uniref:Choline transporter n=2 Tax=Pacificimonas TaxID=1960290 RepID=A0A219B898_9SPHN|nr:MULTISPECIES: BCCT family transporter [Pacificimonas]MBZ6379811.1 BCCT family transporter [Pacificimonas aurantium]OWV34346.1 choline transporter [Pacificimonas flava]
MANGSSQAASAEADFKPTVFYGAILLIAALIGTALWNADGAGAVFSAMQTEITGDFGWLLVLTVNCLLVLCAVLAFSTLGRVKLGGRKAKAEFSLPTWFAMLFSAGMGIGLLFYGVAEPIMHFSNPPATAFSNPEAILPRGLATNAQHAMGLTFLHWGLHAWGIYAIIGLALAFTAFNRNRPLSIGGFLQEAFPRIPNLLIDLIDVLAIVATVCGVATSLGFGASQINAGLDILLGVPETPFVQFLLIAFITGLATISVGLGLNTGIKRLSEANMLLALGLAAFVFILGPTVFILDGFVQNIGYYLQRFLYLSTWTETYSSTEWQGDWTIFYYAWWISWSPFVGIFIARISYGRTVREFVAGVLLVPTLFTFAWMTVFGNSAIFVELFGQGGLADAVNASMPDALFTFLTNFPLAAVSSTIAIIIIATFFVTSADSGALVTAMIASGGQHHAGFGSRVTWAVAIGALAAALLYAGGLSALQTAAIVTGLPFALVLLAMGAGLFRMLHQESARLAKLRA